MKYIDDFLDRFTMFRLLVYVLSAYAGLAIIIAFTGRLTATPTELVISLTLLLMSAYFSDRILGRLFNTPTNMESAIITALILFLIIQPAATIMTGVALVVAGVLSSASKFLLTWNRRHIFNPAALAAATLSLTGLQATTWWIGSSIFWPFTLILGFAIVLKIRRSPLVVAFVTSTVILQAGIFITNNQPFLTNMQHALVASPLIFLATIMLTEPATMPSRQNQQFIFAILIAVFYVFAWELGPFIIYPEVALLLGNLYAFAVSPKFKVSMQLRTIQKISDQVYTYVFTPDRPLAFEPGQYMQWTLDNVHYDSRGNRRTLTIASSPTESEVHLGLKYHEPSSTYKAAFFDMQPGDTIFGSQLAGDFTLRGNENKKLAFIAGGIGITPFRSMAKYITDKQLSVDIVLLYVVGNAQEFAYARELNGAAHAGIRTIPIVTDLSYKRAGVITSKLTPELIQYAVPDYSERIFYISGPITLVNATKANLRGLGLPKRNIRTDHFTGY